MTSQTRRTVCYGLMRIGGAVGFGLGVALVLGIGQHILHLNFSAKSILELSRKEIVLEVLALILGLLGLVVGQAFGFSIPVRSDGLARNIDGLWHFGANSVIVWNVISTLVFGFAMGKEAARAFRATHSTAEMIWLGIVLPVLVGWSIAFVLALCVGILPEIRSSASAKLMMYGSPSAVAFAFGAYEAGKLGLNPRWGLVMAVAPLFLIPASLSYMRKDEQRRVAS